MSSSRIAAILRDLNPPQRDAVNTLRGPLLVLAGAGTGKTRVVTYRIAHLIARGTAPDRILAVTFTNKAANEMKERVTALLGKRQQAKPVVSTFHSHCLQILRRHIHLLGYPNKFAIYDRGDQEGLARTVLREIKVPGSELKPGDLLWFISGWKSASVAPQQAAMQASTDREHLAAVAYRRYQKALKATGAVDFDDLLLCTEKLLAEHDDVRREEAGRFDHLLVDEYQDTNGSQYRIVRALALGHRNLCVVGDDDQSIYGWRGAEVKHILRFKRDWPEATVVRLEDNYRSTSAILSWANTLIAYNSQRYDKVLRAARAGGEKPRIIQFKDETEEAEQIVAAIGRRITDPAVEPRDFAILFRTNEQPRPLETELRRVGLPYVLVGGMSFYDRKEVRDILAYLKVLDSPDDEVSLLRIFNTPPRGIGAKTVKLLMGHALAKGKPLWRVLPDAGSMGGLTDSAVVAVDRFRRLIDHARHRLDDQPLVDVANDLIARVNYREELSRLYPDPSEQEARWGAVEQVVSALGSYVAHEKNPTLSNFLDDTALGGREIDDEKDKALRRNAIVLMTLHAAKGLEFPYVYMVGMEEGLLPHKRSLDPDAETVPEERRLCYVGITRAQERLTLSMALTRMRWGKPRDTQPSRFLYEMTGQADNPNRPQGASRGPVAGIENPA